MPYDASNRKDIRRAEKEAKADDLQRINYLQAAMSHAAGRAWFYDLLEFCHLFNDPFTGNALIEAYRKGERNVGLRIFADLLAHCPDYYIQMVKDANDRRITRDTRRAADDTSADDTSDTSSPELGGSADGGWDSEGRSDAYDA
jgi:hypothetical protein